ncbi:hypothetical protein DIPPA_20160 [Diplonema papillatum]|nr:hypothetical protein DIPPA_20160 [Diplonema papillatum]
MLFGSATTGMRRKPRAADNGWTPVHWACLQGDTKAVVDLLDRCEERTKYGWAALHVAADAAQADIVTLLVQHLKDKYRHDCVRYLGSLTALTLSGDSPMVLACERKNEAVRTLYEEGSAAAARRCDAIMQTLADEIEAATERCPPDAAPEARGHPRTAGGAAAAPPEASLPGFLGEVGWFLSPPAIPASCSSSSSRGSASLLLRHEQARAARLARELDACRGHAESLAASADRHKLRSQRLEAEVGRLAAAAEKAPPPAKPRQRLHITGLLGLCNPVPAAAGGPDDEPSPEKAHLVEGGLRGCDESTCGRPAPPPVPVGQNVARRCAAAGGGGDGADENRVKGGAARRPDTRNNPSTAKPAEKGCRRAKRRLPMSRSKKRAPSRKPGEPAHDPSKELTNTARRGNTGLPPSVDTPFQETYLDACRSSKELTNTARRGNTTGLSPSVDTPSREAYLGASRVPDPPPPAAAAGPRPRGTRVGQLITRSRYQSALDGIAAAGGQGTPDAEGLTPFPEPPRRFWDGDAGAAAGAGFARGGPGGGGVAGGSFRRWLAGFQEWCSGEMGRAKTQVVQYAEAAAAVRQRQDAGQPEARGKAGPGGAAAHGGCSGNSDQNRNNNDNHNSSNSSNNNNTNNNYNSSSYHNSSNNNTNYDNNNNKASMPCKRRSKAAKDPTAEGAAKKRAGAKPLAPSGARRRLGRCKRTAGKVAAGGAGWGFDAASKDGFDPGGRSPAAAAVARFGAGAAASAGAVAAAVLCVLEERLSRRWSVQSGSGIVATRGSWRVARDAGGPAEALVRRGSSASGWGRIDPPLTRRNSLPPSFCQKPLVPDAEASAPVVGF